MCFLVLVLYVTTFYISSRKLRSLLYVHFFIHNELCRYSFMISKFDSSTYHVMLNQFEHVTVEPSLFIFLVVYDWMKGLDTNLFLQKSCRFNSTSEPDLNTQCDDERKGILFITEVGLKYHPIVIFISLLAAIFASYWSDEAGRRRRPLIYISILGQIFHTLLGCLHSYFWQWQPMTAVISFVVLESLYAGVCIMIVACQVYVCDISDKENRTMRLGIVGAIRLLALVLGRGGSGFVLRSFGFFYAYFLCFALSASGLLCGLIFIKDTSVPVDKKMSFYRVFNLKRVIFDSFKVVFNGNLGRKRVTVSMLMIANIAVVFTLFGELSVLYSYLRYRFGWDERKYSQFMFFKLSGSSLGILFCSVVLSKWLKIHDGLIGILAGSFDTIAIVVLLLADQIWQLYLIPVIDIFHGTAMTIGISFISKYYDINELGRLNAVSGVFSLIIPLSYFAYNAIFQRTLDVYPSAFCLLSIALDVIIILCFCGSYYFSKKFDTENSIITKSPNQEISVEK
ncbi:proton-coupled folate transporter-like [Planococcus citri]|uniref:proton-coupled folate transporter-like n=1 Tax=Planococcus citri TaxID=170843 RepID=UPI0031FA22D7